MKRLVETCLVLVTAPLWVPLMALVACLVLLTLGRPVLFRQARAGLKGKPFTLLKFRTMRPGSEPDLERTPPLGRFLRATSLDELPQLLQILTGTMALVGPRPLPLSYLPRYTAAQMRRHEVRPGITGLAQASGRNALSWEQKFALDVEYVERQSLALDVKILFLTVLQVVCRKGINASQGETMPEFTGSASPSAASPGLPRPEPVRST